MSPVVHGIALLAIAAALSFVVFSYTQDLIQLQLLLHKSCDLPIELCPARQIPPESMAGGVLAALLAFLGLYTLWSSRRVSAQKIQQTKTHDQAIHTLLPEEKTVYDTLCAADGTAFQSDLVEKTGLDKVKVTRILDRLEGKGLVERKRRGMSNVVILKH